MHWKSVHFKLFSYALSLGEDHGESINLDLE